jgi:hypothetical protein
MRLPPYERQEIQQEVRDRLDRGDDLMDVLTWLGSTGTTAGEAQEMPEATGIPTEHAEHALTVHPTWRALVTLMGGMVGEQLPGADPTE